jgi:hypothetical protein
LIIVKGKDGHSQKDGGTKEGRKEGKEEERREGGREGGRRTALTNPHQPPVPICHSHGSSFIGTMLSGLPDQHLKAWRQADMG